MGDSVSPILVVGSVALDTVHTPTESATDVLGGGASYFCVAGSIFAPIRLVAVVGDDFSPANRALLESRNIDLGGLEVLKGKTFRWTARYSGVRLEERVTLDTQLNVFAGFHPVLPPAYRSSRVIFLSNIQPELQLEVLDQVENADFVACVGEQGANRLFVMRLVAGDRRHESIGGILRPADAVPVLAVSPRLLDQST